jgi:hypothetical protein
MPFDILEKKHPELIPERIKKYGTEGIPTSVIQQHPEWVQTPMTDPAQRQPVQSLRSLTPLQPVGTQIEASLPKIIPDAKIPKSYNVSALRYNMKGPSDYYNYNQEGVDYETAMKAKAASDAYNAEIEKKYGPESWYYTRKSPKLEAIAAERYKQLRSEFNMTPNYQMGGNVYPVNYVPQAQNGKNKKKKGVQDLLRDVENSVNKSLGNPMQKAHAAAYQLAGKWYNPKTKQWEENDPVDNFRHPMAGRYTSEAIQDKLYNIPILSQMVGLTGSNALGVAHELSTLFHPKDKRGWYDKIRESGEDIFNNAVGATVGSLPISDKRKTNILTKLSNQNMLPDGVSGKGGDMYIKHAMGGFIPQAQEGKKTYSYPLRDKLYPGEDEYFKANPHVRGMAAEDNKVIINPYSGLTDQQKQGIIINESARLAMRNGYERPTFELTPEQKEAFKDYSADEQDQRETIIGRILSGDSSAGNVTPEQKKYAEELQKVLKFQGGGSIPGSPGFTYARTIDPAPSEGPYAKKTMASAQNGEKLNPFTYPKSNYSTNPFLVRDPQFGIFIGGINPTYSTKDFSIGASMVGVGNEHFQKIPADYGIRGSYNPTDSLSINANISKDNIGAGLSYRFQNGGEMKYYQEGLDWKPKTISKNGGWLDQYDEAQDGGEVAQDGWNAAQLKLLKKIKPQNNVVIDTNGVKFDKNGKRVFPNNRALQILADVWERKQKGIPSPQFSNVKVKDERAEAVTKVDNTRTAPKLKVTDLKKLNVRNKTEAELAEIKRKNDEAIIADRKARMADAMKAQDEDVIGNPNWKKVLARETQSTGDKFRIFPNDADSFIDNWLNPFVMMGDMVSGLGAAPYEMERQESMMPLVTGIGAPLLAGALGGIGAKTNKQFINNIFNPVNIVPRSSSAEKYIGNKLKTAIPATSKIKGKIKGKLKKGIEKIQQNNTYKAIDDHMSGLEQGLFSDKRPFFEKFPITKAQKAKVYAAQDKAFEEGNQFIKDWHYGDGIDLHPDIVDKMIELDPNFKLSVFDNTNITNTSGPYANPFAITIDKLISKRRNALKNENITDYAKQYMLENRNKIAGANMITNESLTSRNRGLYHYSPEEIKETVIHEGGHTGEKLGTISHFDANGNYVKGSIPFERIKTYDPNFTSYYFPNPNTDQGKLFQEAMVEPTPHIFDADGNIIKEGDTWEASPGELHSELLPARSNLIDAYVAQGHDRKEIMNMLRADASDAQIDWMIQNKDLNRFFKPTTSPELKRKVIRMLYAGVPAAVGLDALMESEPNESSSGMKRQGGIIKDDRGQWNHPGEITEIGSNQITMQGVPYPVLGISDTGDTKLMKPGKNYKFKGKKVTEFPMAKNGMRQEQKGLQNLDNLLNFTNYNKPQPGGWLNKYN